VQDAEGWSHILWGAGHQGRSTEIRHHYSKKGTRKNKCGDGWGGLEGRDERGVRVDWNDLISSEHYTS